jgi:hypothetical protein
MMSASTVSGRKPRRRLSPSEKYEMWMSIVTGQATQREAAAVRGGPLDGGERVPGGQAGCAGRAGRRGAGPAGSVGAGRGVGGGERRGRAAAGHGGRAGGGAAPACGKSALGLTAGPVPSRVDEHVKAGLLELVDHAVERGWSARRAADLLGFDHVRCGRWLIRRSAGELADRAPGGHPLHGLLEHERAAIVALFEAWGETDRSHRKLAHRGSRLGLVHVSESTSLSLDAPTYGRSAAACNE